MILSSPRFAGTFPVKPIPDQAEPAFFSFPGNPLDCKTTDGFPLMLPAISRFQLRVNSILSGLYGDRLAERGSALALPMQLLHDGRQLDQNAPAPAAPQSVLVIFIHGLMGSETIWSYPKQPDQSYAASIAASIPSNSIFLRYNSGLPVKSNAGDLSEMLETLVVNWPIRPDRIILVGHSMGGLLIRNTVFLAIATGRKWIHALRECVYIGTPHDGSWLARGAEATAGWLRRMPRDYLRVAGEAIDLRSEGIKNLSRRAIADCAESPLPLAPKVRHYSVSGSLSEQRTSIARRAFGDGLVHESSARGGSNSEWPWTDHASFPGIGHIQLARHPAVARKIVQWLS
ncbi:MAG: esterase/lipase family protein [Wenzhouxiangellaceae bacterium]